MEGQLPIASRDKSLFDTTIVRMRSGSAKMWSRFGFCIGFCVGTGAVFHHSNAHTQALGVAGRRRGRSAMSRNIMLWQGAAPNIWIATAGRWRRGRRTLLSILCCSPRTHQQVVACMPIEPICIWIRCLSTRQEWQPPCAKAST